MFAFEDLRVYNDALGFTKEIYKLTKPFPKEEIFGITSQLMRAASSVALNIVEGSGLSKNEFKNFLRRARGSTYECIPILSIALDNHYILQNDYQRVYNNCNALAKSISALIKSIK
jgi:four helix bundle protein